MSKKHLTSFSSALHFIYTFLIFKGLERIMYKVYEIKQRVFADNDLEADKVRTELKKDKTFLLNLMSSPGAGKTPL